MRLFHSDRSGQWPIAGSNLGPRAALIWRVPPKQSQNKKTDTCTHSHKHTPMALDKQTMQLNILLEAAQPERLRHNRHSSLIVGLNNWQLAEFEAACMTFALLLSLMQDDSLSARFFAMIRCLLTVRPNNKR